MPSSPSRKPTRQKKRTRPHAPPTKQASAAFALPATMLSAAPSGKPSPTTADPQQKPLVRASSAPGFPAAEQLHVFLHLQQRKQTGGSTGASGRRRVTGKRISHQADCFVADVDICPEGRLVVMHPGF